MFRHYLNLALIVAVSLPLTGFRMPSKSEAKNRLLYDVRGAFVTARGEVSQALVMTTDTLVDEAIRATLRSTMLPRTIIVVRIDKAARVPLLLGARHEASVTVQAVAVGTGEPIAEGHFDASVYLLQNDGADQVLAQKIAERIASEFRLDAPRHRAIVSALAE
jgi:hypothetical protein